MFRYPTVGSFSITLALFATSLSSSALAQTAAPEETKAARPKIRLSGEETTAPADKPSAPAPKPTAPAAKPTATVTTAAPEEAAAESGTEEATPSAQPGTGETSAESPADADTTEAPPEEAKAPGSEEGAGDAKKLSEPRVIDISSDDEKPMDPADLPPEEPKIPASQLPFTYHVNHIDVHGGFRIVGTYDDELEPFLVDPVMADVFVRGGMAFGLTDRIAIAPSIELGAASGTATVREIDSQIDKVHATLGVEGRYHFIHRMFGYARLAPGLEFVDARLGIEDTSGELSSGKFPGSVGFQFDAALGASLRLFGPSDGRKRDPRLWVFAEGGYRASTKHELSLSVDEDDGPRRAAPVDLAPLHFSGGFFSTGLMASF